MHLEGLPDVISAPSVVKVHNQSTTLSAPASAAANWDCTVAFTGAHTTIGANPMLKSMNSSYVVVNDHAALTNGLPFGSFVCKAGDAGLPLVWGAPGTANDTHEAYGASSLSTDRCRIIAVGFEVTNTTAAVYKQGSTTVAALSSPVGDYNTVEVIDSNAAPYPTNTLQSWMSPMYAATRDALLQVPGVSTWESSEGCYAVPRMTSIAGTVESPTYSHRASVVTDSNSATVSHVSTPISYVTIDGIKVPNILGVTSSGFGAVQVFFCGLSHETTLTVTMRTVVEYFPSFGSTLFPLATPSTAYCPKAFELYSEIARTAPYAVPVRQNAAGDYFRKILKVAGQVATQLAPMTGPWSPYLAAAGSAATGASVMWQRAVDKRAEKALKKRQPQRDGRVPPPVPMRIQRKEAGARAMVTRR